MFRQLCVGTFVVLAANACSEAPIPTGLTKMDARAHVTIGEEACDAQDCLMTGEANFAAETGIAAPEGTPVWEGDYAQVLPGEPFAPIGFRGTSTISA